MLRSPRCVRLVCVALFPTMLLLGAAPPYPDRALVTTQFYFDVADLVTAPGMGPLTVRVTPGGTALPSETNKAGARLVERVTSAVAPGTWAAHGGSGTIEYRPADRTLLGAQSPAVQRQVRDFLRSLRRGQDTAVVLETWAVQVSQETAERLRLAPTAGGILDGVQFIHIRRLLADAEQYIDLPIPTVSCWTGQAVNFQVDRDGIDAEFGVSPTVSSDRRTVRPNLRLCHDRIGGTRFEGVIPQGSTLVLPGPAVTRRLNFPSNIPYGSRFFDTPRRERAERTFVFLTPRVLPTTDAERAANDTVRDRVQNELNNLGSAEGGRREAAYDALWRIGQLAPFSTQGPISELALFRDPARWDVISRFCRAMQAKYGVVPVRGDGIEVTPVVDLVWKAPAPGGKTPVRLALKVTNVGEKPIAFNRLCTIPSVISGEGVWEMLHAANRDHFCLPEEVFTPLKPGRSLIEEPGRVELHSDDDGKSFWLSYLDKTDGGCGIGGLKRGRNFVSFKVECFGRAGQGGWFDAMKNPHPYPIWFGEVHSALICIEIR